MCVCVCVLHRAAVSLERLFIGHTDFLLGPKHAVNIYICIYMYLYMYIYM